MIHPGRIDVLQKRAVSGICILSLLMTLAACGGGQSGDKEEAGGATQGETTQASSGAVTYALPGEEVYPEGIAYRPETGEFFVGSTTDGTILRGVVGGGDEAEVFLQEVEDVGQLGILLYARQVRLPGCSSPAVIPAASSSTTSTRESWLRRSTRRRAR